ncbi:MAG: hypothetical protein GC146_03985 [Limimaricola sp.]|uniref:hypothetical protein n=1 Tax=Limimaricola sp. TaxID=2211665 RepID=UPI001DD62F4E|nr:hypothetical protein [Limimaricola sp.]MBI1416361.1 hypothetical protein [Limimaricola sp.]
MVKLRPVLVALFLATPLAAQEAPPAAGPDDGMSLMDRGAQLFMRGLMQQMAPAVEDLRGLAEKAGPAMKDFVATMGPAMLDLLARVDDLRNYQPPEFLPNGDIIIRRKPDAPPFTPPPPGPPPQVDL